MVRELVARSLALLCLAAAGTAQDDMPWLLAGRVDVAGNTTFSVAELRGELMTSARVADALLRAEDADQADQAIADCVADGYRRTGFVDVAVHGERADGRLRLDVVEGPRCRTGSVRVTGNHEVAADAITSTMRTAEGAWRGWQGDGFADCSSIALARARQRIVLAYAGAGRWGGAAQVAFVRAGQRVDLVVTVRDEGRLVPVGRLRLGGERPDDADAVLHRIQPPEDAALTTELVHSLHTQLEDLGRYIAVGSPIDAARPGRTATSPRIDVKVASFAPAMKDMPWEDLAQLRAGLATARAHVDGGKAVRIVAALDEETPWLGFTLLPGPLVFTLAKDGFGVRIERVRQPDGSLAAAEALFSATRTLIALGDGACGVLDYTGADFAVTASLTTNDDGSFGLRWGIGMSKGDPTQAQFATWIHPASALRLLQRGYVARDGDDLAIDVPGGQLRIDRAGAVRSQPKEGDVTSALLPMTFGEVIDAARQRLRKDRVQPLGAYLLHFGAANAAALAATTTPAQRDALACLRAAADWWRARPAAASSAADDDGFEVPGSGPWPGMAGVIAPMLFVAAKQTPESSWLAQLVKPMRALMQRRVEGVRAVGALAAADSSGPFATAAAAALLDAAGYGGVAEHWWQRAIERCTADAAIADLRALVSPDAPPPWLVDLAAHLRNDAKTAAIFADLGADATPLDVLARAFARCWDAGLGDRVRFALQERD